MIDIAHLKRLKLNPKPWGQQLVATLLLFPNYHIFARVEIELEGIEHIPRDESVIFAMNHTDRFNYWPFQYQLRKLKVFRYSTVWVKAKYYQNALLAKGLDLCNLIPVPTMGYLLQEFFQQRMKRKMEKPEYRIFKDILDGKCDPGQFPQKVQETMALLGESFVLHIRRYYDELMGHVAELSRKALFEKQLNLIIFPEGTRSVTLGEGKSGLAQLALHTKKKVVPVGCNNSEEVYRGSWPFARSGRIVYRIGEPLSPDNQLKECQIEEDFHPLSRESQERYRAQFELATKIIMERIDQLLDRRYRISASPV
ncbi:MAG: lysophospholipid acyltransferase family protein [Smithellaceae bacterium]|nr:lysophospholipid acyltransferase family protein [Smithellaceae bacterium]